jgi:pilus assembly protein Flp/PilA
MSIEERRVTMKNLIRRLWKDEEGPTAVEYAVMVGIVAVVLLTTVPTLGGAIRTYLNGVGTSLPAP